MTYYRNSRSLELQTDSSTYKTFTGSPVYRSLVYPTVIEGVYSWRTGRNAVSDPAPSPTTRKSFDDWGIRTPASTGNLVERLADRKRYTDEVMRSAFPAETATGSVSVNRVSSTDSGHVFSKVTCGRWPLRYFHSVRSATSTKMEGTLFVSTANYNPRVPSGSEGYYTFTAVSDSLLTDTQRQAMHNRYFRSTAPDAKSASLAVTVLELLKGDVPSILRNFRRSVYKDRAVKYLGGEFLNVTFGWSPIIRDYIGMILVFLTIDRMIYSESDRRHRQFDGPTQTTTTFGNTTPSLSFNGHSGTLNTSTNNAVLTTGSFYLETKKTVSENYRYSSRYSSIAKPSTRSNAFADRAEEILRRIGLVDDPTLLWELIPWSWLVDWALSLGASLANANTYSPITGKYAVDYAYVTTQSTVEIRERVVSFTKQSGNTNLIDSMQPLRKEGVYISTARTRDRATPFGFGTQLGSLNASQFGILVALGLAKSR